MAIDTSRTRQRLVISTAMNMVSEMNRIILQNARKREPAELIVPRFFDRAFMVFHESGIVPATDYLSDRIT